MVVTCDYDIMKSEILQPNSEVCPNVATEPTLQHVSNKKFFITPSANTECGACSDVRAQGSRVFIISKPILMSVYSLADTNCRTSLATCF